MHTMGEIDLLTLFLKIKGKHHNTQETRVLEKKIQKMMGVFIEPLTPHEGALAISGCYQNIQLCDLFLEPSFRSCVN